jgi:hypothetical protein
VEPLDERYGGSVAKARPPLELEPTAPEPHDKVRLSEANRQGVAQALIDGYPQAAIAKALGVSAPTLRRLMADDREDPRLKLEADQGGVLPVPAPMDFDAWSAAAAAQQAKYRIRNPETDACGPGADALRARAQRGCLRTRPSSRTAWR